MRISDVGAEWKLSDPGKFALLYNMMLAKAASMEKDFPDCVGIHAGLNNFYSMLIHTCNTSMEGISEIFVECSELIAAGVGSWWDPPLIHSKAWSRLRMMEASGGSVSDGGTRGKSATCTRCHRSGHVRSKCYAQRDKLTNKKLPPDTASSSSSKSGNALNMDGICMNWYYQECSNGTSCDREHVCPWCKAKGTLAEHTIKTCPTKSKSFFWKNNNGGRSSQDNSGQ